MGRLVVIDGFVDSEAGPVTVLLATVDDIVCGQATAALNLVVSLLPSSVTTKGNETALQQSLKQECIFAQNGNADQARKTLEQALSHTDGCALRGSPDTGCPIPSQPPAKDYINNCVDQGEINPLRQDALDSPGESVNGVPIGTKSINLGQT